MDAILGTAGHIDHGKTALVAALTGIDCDRLEEEKRRGITIELGFAWLDLPDGRRLGIVDVPGHERFIKNMVAGASGVDCVLLVVAADEGVMPQTREHVEICSLLGCSSGIVVLTKADLVDAEWLKAVEEDVQNALQDTFLADAPVIPVSSLTGTGIPRLRQEIARQIDRLPKALDSNIFRLPVDRVFSMKGFGTVVTGTIISGSCAQGEKLVVIPSGLPARARSIQVHNTQEEQAHTGQRCAVNLQGLEVDDIRRGDILARPDTLFPSRSWFVRLSCLRSSPLPIRQRSEIHFHHGAKECLARIVFFDRDKLEPGQSAIAEVKFEQPLAALYGDHCVIRSHSPLRTIGGGIVVCPCPPVLSRRQSDFRDKLQLLQKLGETKKSDPAHLVQLPPDELVRIALALSPLEGTDLNHFQVMTGLTREQLHTALQRLKEKGETLCWDESGGSWAAAGQIQKCLEKCRNQAESLHRRNPLKNSFAPSSLLEGWGKNLPDKFTQKILELAVETGILRQDGSGLSLAGHKVNFTKGEAKILDTIYKKIKAGGRTPPFIKEISEERNWEPKKIQPLLAHLCESGKLVKIQDGVYYEQAEFTAILDLIRAWFATHEDLDVANLKEILGLSRKYAIPILEYLDSARITYRVDNKRRLRKS